MLKAKPNLELRIRTLKRDWAIVYDMLSEKKIVALPVNSNIVVSLIMKNLLPSMQKIEPLGKMLKQ
ncbi:hypothetical protein Goshw_015624 [Gossypium schwendimanii]|uniref:Uncharacterized protein n=1 Tax=Gossypium schwendimanii TaxID=34291 RepID=A0A7J9NFD3_GOSSC|nr:hypothetical protein [Gossypium schwendimanii]